MTLNFFLSSTSDIDVLARAGKSVQDYIKLTKKAELVFSAKTIVMGSSQRLVDGLVTIAAHAGVSISPSSKGVYLGTDVSSKSSRSIPNAVLRRGRASDKDKIVKKMHLKRAQQRLHLGAVVPTEVFSSESYGLAPSVLTRLRARHAQYLGRKPGWCTTSLLALESPTFDPGVDVPLR